MTQPKTPREIQDENEAEQPDIDADLLADCGDPACPVCGEGDE